MAPSAAHEREQGAGDLVRIEQGQRLGDAPSQPLGTFGVIQHREQLGQRFVSVGREQRSRERARVFHR